MQETIESLLAQMTLEEKVAMAAGSDAWHSTGVERLGISHRTFHQKCSGGLQIYGIISRMTVST